MAFAADTDPSGTKPGAETNPMVGRFFERAAGEYAKLSPTPKDFDAFVSGITHMWATQPNWSAADLKRIKTPVLVVDGDHDELIKREHTQYIASTIPGARLVILSNTSHFAFLQNPREFNVTVMKFLGDE